jgi:hypothetical protein
VSWQCSVFIASKHTREANEEAVRRLILADQHWRCLSRLATLTQFRLRRICGRRIGSLAFIQAAAPESLQKDCSDGEGNSDQPLSAAERRSDMDGRPSLASPHRQGRRDASIKRITFLAFLSPSPSVPRCVASGKRARDHLGLPGDASQMA